MLSGLVKKYGYSILCGAFILTVFWTYRSYQEADIPRAPKVIVYKDLDEHTGCYKTWAFDKFSEYEKKLRDISDIADEIVEPTFGRNIFFHQTDCIHDGQLKLSARQACGVESAAKSNPEHSIFLLYPSPVGFLNSTPLPFFDAIMSYSNVHVHNANLEKISNWTPAQEFIQKKDAIYTTQFVNYHMMDFLRVASLWKWGGTCMDLDVIVKKDISKYDFNYAGAGFDEATIYSSILNLSREGVGRIISAACLQDIADNFNAADSFSTGQSMLTRVLRSFCKNVTLTAEMTREQCDGFQVLPRKEFYAYDWQKWTAAFLEAELTTFLETVKDSSVVHFTDKLSYEMTVSKGSNVGYNVLAEEYCPKVYAAIQEENF